MSSFLLTWVLCSSFLTFLAFSRCTVCLYVLALVPIVLLAVFLLLRHYPTDTDNKAIFFKDFIVGGHRGSPFHAPENSLASLQKARDEGCQLVEFDIQLSSDGVAILMHDETTRRTSNKDFDVNKSHSRELVNLELKPVNGVNGSVPTLHEVVDWCKKNDIKMIFDVKDGDTKLISDIVRLIADKNLYSMAIVSSFNPFVPYALKWHDSRILTGFTSRRGYYSTTNETEITPRGHFTYQWALEILDTLVHLGIETMIYPRFLGVDMLLLNHRDISLEKVRQARHNFDIHVVGWTVNKEEEMLWFRDVAQIPFLTDEPYKLSNKTN